MTNQRLRILLLVLIPLTMLAAEVFGDEDKSAEPTMVKVYLPREKEIDKPSITLDDIACITGRDKTEVARVSAVKLGRAPFPGETMTFSRQAVLAQIVSAGLAPSKVNLMGAKEITLRRTSSVITGEDLVNAAREYLQANVLRRGMGAKIVGKPADLVLSEKTTATLSCSLDKQSPGGHARVIVKAISGDQTLDSRKLLFKLTYQSQRVVATRNILAGEEITPHNAKIEIITTTQPPGKWTSPFGHTARCGIKDGETIKTSQLIAPKPQLLVKRNRPVRIKVHYPGWSITTLGVALQDGHTGELIKVRNIRSKKIIIARVDKTGNVVPLLNSNTGEKK